ncbi:MAG: YCF48-related protein [Patescibacteria group bacterium]|jgi:photosystem II stability/assembly factor-like uncharacterized protein
MKTLFRPLIIGLAMLTLVGAGCSLSGTKTDDTSKNGGVYKSTDSGISWSQSTAYPTAKGVGNIGTAEILDLAIDPLDHEAIYAGTSENGLLYSYNSGVAWFSVEDTSMQTNSINAVGVDPLDLCTVFAASGARLYRTDTCGRTFESVYDETRQKTYVRKIALDWYNDGVLYIGLSNGDILKSSNNGATWVNVLATKDEINSILISNQDSRVVLVGANGSLWKSTDSGATWTEKTDNLDSFKNANKVIAMTQDKTGAAIYMASKYGLLKSIDAGDTWNAIKLLTAASEVTIRTLAVSPKDANTVYYATDSTLYYTNDGGINWDTQKLSDGWSASALLIDPTETNVIYLGREKLED